MSEPTVRVLVVDDGAPFRVAARAVVERCPGFVLAGEAVSGEEAVELAGRLAPELVLMDINMGGIDGIEATRRIADVAPGTRVVLVSTYAVDQLPAAARTSGAIAYVHKDDLSPRVLRGVWEAGGDAEWRQSG